jgi:hypothetical protein
MLESLFWFVSMSNSRTNFSFPHLCTSPLLAPPLAFGHVVAQLQNRWHLKLTSRLMFLCVQAFANAMLTTWAMIAS